MTAILTLLKQQAIKTISPNWAIASKVTGGKTNYIQLEEEVEFDKLEDLIGSALLQDLQDNPETPDNIILLDGGTFKDAFDNDIRFKGLRYVLAYMVFSEYIIESSVNDSYTGLVNKNRQESRSINGGDVYKQQARARKLALKEWELAKQFLDKNYELYPFWKASLTVKPYTPKLIGLKKTLR